MENRNRIVSAAGFMIFAGVSLLFFSRAGITPDFFNSIVLKTMELSLLSSVQINLNYLIAGILLFPASLAFVGIYALVSETIDWSLAGVSAALFVLILAFSGTGVTSIALGLGLFISPLIVQYVAIDDKKAYKEFRPGRMVSKAAGTALLAISILAALSVFFVTSADPSYGDAGVGALVDTTMIMAGTAGNAELGTLSPGQVLTSGELNQVKEQMKSLPLFGSLKNFYPHLSAITVFSSIQLFAIMVLAPLAGLYGWIFWRFTEKESGQEQAKQ